MASLLDNVALHVTLRPGWELQMRREMLHVVHPVFGTIPIPEDYAFTDAYRDNLSAGFEDRCGAVPDVCLKCYLGRNKTVMGLKIGYRGKHIWNVRVFRDRTVDVTKYPIL